MVDGIAMNLSLSFSIEPLPLGDNDTLQLPIPSPIPAFPHLYVSILLSEISRCPFLTSAALLCFREYWPDQLIDRVVSEIPGIER